MEPRRIRLEVNGEEVKVSFGLENTSLTEEDIKSIALALDKIISPSIRSKFSKNPIELCINSGKHHYDVQLR